MKDFAKRHRAQNSTFSIHHSYTIHPQSEDFQLHKHQTYEIVLFLQGSAKSQVEGNQYTLSPGDVLVVSYNETHMLYVDEDCPYERIVIELADDVLTPFSDRQADFFSAINERPLGTDNLIGASLVKQYGLDKYIHRIFDLFEAGGNENEVVAQCVTIELLAAIKKILTTEITASASPTNQKVEAVLKYINANLDKDLSLDALASHFYISKYHLCRIFKKHTTFSINQYISMKRVILASALVTAGASTTDACFQSGFNDYSSFYKAYKKHMQETPWCTKKRRNNASQ